MNKQNFTSIITNIKSYNKVVDDVGEYGINLIDFSNDLMNSIDILLKEFYGADGLEWIYWFIYEKDGRDTMKAWDENGLEICRTIEELYDYLNRIN